MASDSCPEGVLCISWPLVGICILALFVFVWYNKHSIATRFTKGDDEPTDSMKKTVEPIPDKNQVHFVYAPRITDAAIRRINIPTRGPVPDYQQIGILTDEKHAKILPLYGRPTYNGSNQWNYFTSTDKFNMLPLPVHAGPRNCTNDQCSELNDDDSVAVPAYGHDKFRLTLYHLDAPRYIPFV